MKRYYSKDRKRPSFNPATRTGQYAFVSYSSKNWDFVRRLVDVLRSDGVWVDKWNIDLGEALPARIESGLENAAEFIFVLSKESLASNWAKYESHMAVIRSLEDRNFRIIVVKIDDSKIPLRFRPFLYVDGSKDAGGAIAQIQKAIRDRREGRSGTVYRRQFVNRHEDIGKIDLAVTDPDRSVVCVYGMYGMGKRTTVEETAKRIWQRPSLAAVELSEAHFGARLTLELCAIAALKMPSDGAPAHELRRNLLLAAETIVGRGQILLFDRVEALMNDVGVIHEDLLAVVDHVSRIPASFKVPLFLLSRRLPKFGAVLGQVVAPVKLSEMRAEHIVSILENEINRIERKIYSNRSALLDVAKHLHGYPLAARLAAPLLVKHAPEYLLANLVHITELRRDVADAILSHTRLTSSQIAILKILSICDAPLAVPDLSEITGHSAEATIQDIDHLADNNLVEPHGVAVRLHALVLDFYWKQARSSPEFHTIVSSIANYSSISVKKQKVGGELFLQWLSVAVRTLFLSGDHEAARSLRRDFVGELKIACIELYQRQEYKLCLRYCEEYLQAVPTDFDVLLHKARALSRMGKAPEALTILDELLSAASTPIRKVRILFAIARTHLEAKRDEEARTFYIKTLSINPNHLPALEGMTELLMKQQKIREADGFVERAIRVAPMNSWALSAHADLLWRNGKVDEAIREMTKAVNSQPDNPTFLFRLGRFYQQRNNLPRAYELLKSAVDNDHSYLDARLSLASVAISLGKQSEASTEIAALKDKIGSEKKHVLDNIQAEYYLMRSEIERASDFANSSLAQRRDVFSLGVMAKVEAARAKQAGKDGLTVLAESYRSRAEALIEEGLAIDPVNLPLRAQRDGLRSDGLAKGKS
jgi:predicted Zn-dependent protease